MTASCGWLFRCLSQSHQHPAATTAISMDARTVAGESGGAGGLGSMTQLDTGPAYGSLQSICADQTHQSHNGSCTRPARSDPGGRLAPDSRLPDLDRRRLRASVGGRVPRLQPSGGIRWIHERGVFADEAGGPQRVSGISTDITDRRLAEAALRESERATRSRWRRPKLAIGTGSPTPTSSTASPRRSIPKQAPMADRLPASTRRQHSALR